MDEGVGGLKFVGLEDGLGLHGGVFGEHAEVDPEVGLGGLVHQQLVDHGHFADVVILRVINPVQQVEALGSIQHQRFLEGVHGICLVFVNLIKNALREACGLREQRHVVSVLPNREVHVDYLAL